MRAAYRYILLPVILLLVSGLLVLPVYAQNNPVIRINQVGFYPKQAKIAIAENLNAGKFYVIASHSADTVFRGMLQDPSKDIYSGKINAVADFSALTAPGSYYLYIPAAGNSYSFSIKNKVYQSLAKGVLKAYYFMRCSETLLPVYAGKWARAEGHPDTAVLIHPSAATEKRPAGTVISSPGGWYDAGDYNKYIVNSGISMATLLSAYEDFPVYFDALHTNIPEGGDHIPDILNEVLWNLRWMLTMQDPHDGGVYHKLTNAVFDKMEMPADARAPRYVVEKSTAATLDFAAVMAQAARVFNKFKRQLPGLSDSCIHAAGYAWQWAIQHPNVIYDQEKMNERYSPAVTTGTYGDRNIQDEKYWAGIELFVTTGKEDYYKAVQPLAPRQFLLPSWGMVSVLGEYTLVRFRGSLKNKVKELPAIEKQLTRFADQLLDNSGKAYQTVMGGRAHDFIWGSNSVAANQGVALLQAYLLTKDKKYLDGAIGNLDYLLGRNATGYCFVTGFGSKSPMHPHHRPSVADGIKDPVPGFVVAGPNPGQQDKCTTYPSHIPDESYTDDDRAYACNEIAINWNAPVVYLVNAVEAIH